MSLAHLHMTYAAATSNPQNNNLIFNSNLPNFHSNSLSNHQIIQNSVGTAAVAAAAVAAANIQYQNHQNYLSYQHHYHQTQINQFNTQQQQQQQRSTFAIQELLGLSNETNTNTQNILNRNYLQSSVKPTETPKALKISTNFENNNHLITSINNNNFKNEQNVSFELENKLNDNYSSLNDNIENNNKNENNKEAVVAAAAAAVAYGAYFSRNNFIPNYSPSKVVNQSEFLINKKTSKLNIDANTELNNSDDNNSLDENDNDEDSYGIYLFFSFYYCFK